MPLGSILGAMTGSKFLGIIPGLEVSGKNLHSFVGGELSFLKLGSVLVGLSAGVSNFS